LLEERSTHLVQPGKCELRLGLHADQALHPEARTGRSVAGIFEHGALPDARLTSDDQRPASPRVRIHEELFDRAALAAPSQEVCHLRSNSNAFSQIR
jgi:hypothetical protein